ncbi:MAG: hypothetical protein WCY19_02240 [Candidatus Gastranaerophilaceae bacterium]
MRVQQFNPATCAKSPAFGMKIIVPEEVSTEVVQQINVFSKMNFKNFKNLDVGAKQESCTSIMKRMWRIALRKIIENNSDPQRHVVWDQIITVESADFFGITKDMEEFSILYSNKSKLAAALPKVVYNKYLELRLFTDKGVFYQGQDKLSSLESDFPALMQKDIIELMSDKEKFEHLAKKASKL